MNRVQRLYRADDRRKTRIHDQKGNLLGFAGLLYTPRVFLEAVLRTTFGYRAIQPWISYRAAAAINRLLTSQSEVLEFGSGMSTVWFARRSAHVVSIESDAVWFDRVKAMLAKRGLTNVDLHLRQPGDLTDLRLVADGSVDFVLVDGLARALCVDAALAKLKRGGYVYLDNTDDADEGTAETRLLAAARERGGEVRYFTDFVPGQMTAVQGLLVRL